VKSRNKKTVALESFERECESLRLQVTELVPQVAMLEGLVATLREEKHRAERVTWR
jgi:hypothetical protein